MSLEIPPTLENPALPVRLQETIRPASGGGAATSRFSAFCRDLLRDERRLQETMKRLSRTRTLDPVSLLALQALVHAHMQRMEVVSRCVQSVQGALQHLRQGQ